MKKYLANSIVIIAAVVIVFYLWTAKVARQKSDDILSKFNEINKGLKSSYDSGSETNGIGAVHQLYLNGSLQSEIILLIDSLKECVEQRQTSSNTALVSKQFEADIKRLLHHIQMYNANTWIMVDSRIPDTISYWHDKEVFSEQKWLLKFFKNEPNEAVITYLNYLKNQFIKA